MAIWGLVIFGRYIFGVFSDLRFAKTEIRFLHEISMFIRHVCKPRSPLSETSTCNICHLSDAPLFSFFPTFKQPLLKKWDATKMTCPVRLFDPLRDLLDDLLLFLPWFIDDFIALQENKRIVLMNLRLFMHKQNKEEVMTKEDGSVIFLQWKRLNCISFANLDANKKKLHILFSSLSQGKSPFLR